jgi:hypothetical protein
MRAHTHRLGRVQLDDWREQPQQHCVCFVTGRTRLDTTQHCDGVQQHQLASCAQSHGKKEWPQLTSAKHVKMRQCTTVQWPVDQTLTERAAAMRVVARQ